MIAYKGFEPGLVCRDYQFVMGKNVTEQANCAANGFHCAENPLGCLSYYPDMTRSVYCVVEAGGDMDEDARDSKIACTELTIVKQLSMEEFFLHALAYMVDHPYRQWNGRVQKNRGSAYEGYVVVRGTDPLAKGKLGDILALAKENAATKRISHVALMVVDGTHIQPVTWYDINSKERKDCEHE